MDKAEKIVKLANEMLDEAIPEIRKKIERAVKVGAIDIDSWDEHNNPMILPKVILIASLESDAEQYKAKGTSFEKRVELEVRNLKIFL